MKEPYPQSIDLWLVIGFFSLTILGSLLHFTYEWSHRSPIVGMFSAVNESVWEHLKLGFWALCVYSSVEYWFFRGAVNNYFIAKACGILVLQLFILLFHYTFTFIAGRHLVILDIALYVCASALCQRITHRIITADRTHSALNVLGALLIILHAIILVIFTFMPPRLPLFMDNNTGRFGTEWYAPPNNDG